MTIFKEYICIQKRGAFLMICFIVRVAVALVTFSIGVGFALIFTANHQVEPSFDLQTRESQYVPPSYTKPNEPAYSLKPLPEFTFDYDPKEFNPRGVYFILGRKPKEFREFEAFEMAIDETNGRVWGYPVFATRYYGNNEDYHVITGNGEYALKGLVTKKRLIFVAAPISEEDFEYRFDGRFLKSGQVYKAGKNQAVLKGKLTKLKNGVKIAEREVKFRIEYLGC
jgi:hypothetical protein